MNREEIIKLARESGLFVPHEGIPENGAFMRFAYLVAAAERERYIKIMQMIDTHYSGSLDYQPAYVEAARQVLDVIDWPNA